MLSVQEAGFRDSSGLRDDSLGSKGFSACDPNFSGGYLLSTHSYPQACKEGSLYDFNAY